jgi:hypothetical protein
LTHAFTHPVPKKAGKTRILRSFFRVEISAISPFFTLAPYSGTSGKPGPKKSRYIAGLNSPQTRFFPKIPK